MTFTERWDSRLKILWLISQWARQIETIQLGFRRIPLLLRRLMIWSNIMQLCNMETLSGKTLTESLLHTKLTLIPLLHQMANLLHQFLLLTKPLTMTSQMLRPPKMRLKERKKNGGNGNPRTGTVLATRKLIRTGPSRPFGKLFSMGRSVGLKRSVLLSWLSASTSTEESRMETSSRRFPILTSPKRWRKSFMLGSMRPTKLQLSSLRNSSTRIQNCSVSSSKTNSRMSSTT